MSLSDGFFNGLQRHFINGNVKDISRLNHINDRKALCETWISTQHAHITPQIVQRIVHQATRISGIILGVKDYQIQFADQDAAFLERPKADTIIVSTEPLKAYADAPWAAIDVITGQILHHAALIKERNLNTEPIDLEETLTTLYYLAEDLIVDTIVTKQFPGYEGYLLKYREYFVDGKLRYRWGAKFESRVFQTMLALRSAKPVRIHRKSVRHAYFYMLHLLLRNPTPEMLRDIDRLQTAKTLYELLFSEKIYAHWGKVNHRSERFVFGEDGPPTPGENGNKKGGTDGHKTFNPINSKLLDSLPHTDIPDIHDIHLPEQTPKSKLNMVDKRLLMPNPAGRQTKTSFAAPANSNQGKDKGFDYKLQMGIPERYHLASQRYLEAVRAVKTQIAALGKQFAERNTLASTNQYGLHTGTLDEHLLYKIKYSRAVFTKSIVRSQYTSKLDVILLADVSSSMFEKMTGSNLPKYVVAQHMAALFVEAMEQAEDVQTWVFSYASQGKRVDVHELYSPAFQGQKDHLGDLFPFPERQTPEYEALLAVTNRLRYEGRTGVQKVFLVFSDGKPEDDVMTGQEQTTRIRRLVRKQHNAGHHVIQIALGDEIGTSEAYPYCIPLSERGYPAIIRSFGALLGELASPNH